MKHGPQYPPTMPWGFLAPSPDYSGLGPGTKLIRVIVSHGYGFLARATTALATDSLDQTKTAADYVH